MKSVFKRVSRHRNTGFTIVELLIVIVVIGILAAITIVAYNGITARANASAAQAALTQLGTQAETYKIQNSDTYATHLSDMGINNSAISYTSSGTSYCGSITVPAGVTYYVSNSQTSPSIGTCPFMSGGYIQTATTANCPSTRAWAVDARDSRTYLIQKLADGKCWMLTNLAYAGGGVNTYGDVKTIILDPGSGSTSYTQPGYYIPAGANPTTSPTTPSPSTTGTGQYGYFYNWCGAMGGQATGACASIATPVPDTSITICPSGWHIPTSNGGDFSALNTAINGGLTNTDAGLKSTWLGQYGGYWLNGSYSYQGSRGFYWSSTQFAPNNADDLFFYSTNSSPNDGTTKHYGYAVRCIAN